MVTYDRNILERNEKANRQKKTRTNKNTLYHSATIEDDHISIKK